MTSRTLITHPTALNASEMRDAAAALRKLHRRVAHQADVRARTVGNLAASGTHGTALRTAEANLTQWAHNLMPPAEGMMQAAGLLDTFAALQDRVQNILIGAAKLAPGPVKDSLIDGATSLGEAIDAVCAVGIAVLCTPSAAEPPRQFEDFPDMTLRGIHETQRAFAPPAVLALTESHPDALILEAAEGHLVALIPPPHGLIPDHEVSTVTTFVPGVGSSAAESWGGSLDRARSMAAATNGPVVAWMGYTAPATLAHGTARHPATAASSRLSDFQRALSTRFPAARQTVVGYSYGSVVAGTAARVHGLHADALVLVGSPGAGSQHARELRLRGRHGKGTVYAVTAQEDPIDLVSGPRNGVHGINPTSSAYGAQPWPRSLHGDHGSYFTNPSFLEELGAITRGGQPPK